MLLVVVVMTLINILIDYRYQGGNIWSCDFGSLHRDLPLLHPHHLQASQLQAGCSTKMLFVKLVVSLNIPLSRVKIFNVKVKCPEHPLKLVQIQRNSNGPSSDVWWVPF